MKGLRKIMIFSIVMKIELCLN